MAKVFVRVKELVTYEREWDASDAEAAELILMAKNGRWNEVGETAVDVLHAKESEIYEDSIDLVVNGKTVYE